MTLKERLEEIYLSGISTDGAITAILQAFKEHLPHDKPVLNYEFDTWGNGWNSYRQELLKLLGDG